MWSQGTQALVVLKSPIGDLRNKLYTRTGSPFADIPVPELATAVRRLERWTHAVSGNGGPDATSTVAAVCTGSART